jgi:hypothetical protein
MISAICGYRVEFFDSTATGNDVEDKTSGPPESVPALEGKSLQ